jgi:molybdenum cofactor guanylyltransferase
MKYQWKNQLSIVIQAGGQSERMGQDKGLVLLGGKPLVQHILDQTDGLAAERIIISNKPDAYLQFGIPVFPDVIQGIGALGGIYSALYYAGHEICLVLACDMPFVNLRLIHYLLDLSDGYDIVIPRLHKNEFAEPFRAVYRKNCLPAIERVIESGQRRVISFFPQVRVRYVDWAEFSPLDPQQLTFYNVNTPEDLREAEKIFNSGESDQKQI